ncbi:hypothetical protein L7F22_049224 [Adiantum nelumboides]|nr:hypothetical protein [Adiantum nelumboides]
MGSDSVVEVGLKPAAADDCCMEQLPSKQGPTEVPAPLAAGQQVLHELQKLGGIAVPVAAMNLVVYARAMVSVLCLGRLGGLELAGGALSIGFTNITGYSVLFGLASGMDPICGQAFGAQNWALIGLCLQRTILILITASIPISLLWFNLQRILLWLGQDASITAVASTYCIFSMPDLLINCFSQPLRVYMRSQGITAPMMWCSAFAVLLHIPLNILLVFVLKLGVPGVAIAAAWTNLNMVLFLLAYLRYSEVYKKTWSGWSRAALKEWWPLWSLALPSCFAICLEWWWYEILTLLAGYLPNPKEAVGSTAILIQTTSLMYTIPLALSASVSTRVGNELGAGRPDRARVAAMVALGVAAVVAVGHLGWATGLKNVWGRLFTQEESVLALTASVMPLVGLCELGNCPQTTGCGVLRGSARPVVAARINLGSFYLVGTPVAVALAFHMRLGFTGLWFGLLAAQAACAVSVLYVVFTTDWHLEACKAKQLSDSNPSVELSTNHSQPCDIHMEAQSDEERATLLSSKPSSLAYVEGKGQSQHDMWQPGSGQ